MISSVVIPEQSLTALQMCSHGRQKIITPRVRQNEPLSLFSESQEGGEAKIDFSKLDITEAVQHGAKERFHQLLEEGVSPNTGMVVRSGQVRLGDINSDVQLTRRISASSTGPLSTTGQT